MTMDSERTGAAATAPLPPANPIVGTTRRSNRLLDLALAAAAILAIGGVAFAIGRGTAPAASPDFTRGGLAPGGAVVGPDGSFDPGAGPNGARPGFALAGGLAIEGTVTAVDADSITLKLANGDEMTFDLDDSTAYHEASEASQSDVAVGDDVSVTASGDGRVRAGGAGDSSSETPRLSATDVTVGR